MSTRELTDDEAAELVELLCFIVDLCETQDSVVSLALGYFVGMGYDAGDLHDDAARLAGVVARAVGIADPVGGRRR